MSTEKKPWFVAVNGAEDPKTFDDEESANRHASDRRGKRDETKAGDMTKKIAVYQKGTRRHEKAIESGAAPADPEATPEPPKQPEKSDDPPKGESKPKK